MAVFWERFKQIPVATLHASNNRRTSEHAPHLRNRLEHLWGYVTKLLDQTERI